MLILRTLNINGEDHSVALRAGDTLLDVIREKLRLTGAKKACNVGDCGACTVLVDGEPMNACLLLAATMEGKAITTIEGLTKYGELTPLQRAFVNEGGIQCGFCTPGMVLSATALLNKNPNPSTEEIKDSLAGNLCRCTGYSGILRAVERCQNYRDDGTCAGKQSTVDFAPLAPGSAGGCSAGGPASAHDSVAVSIPRIDAADKVTGRAIYTADIALPNMIHGKILGSSIAHGFIKRIDTAKARAPPGVLAVITGADVPDTQHGVSPARYDEDVLCKTKVRHVGDPVAAVAAVDEKTAEDALKFIEVEYEELPALLDPFTAIAECAPLIHDRYKCNINTHVEQSFGDIEKAFAESYHVREETFTGNSIYQSPLEPHASLVP